MARNKKKFISKKNSITFHLVHRSQQDPLAADESAPQRVLVPEVKKEKTKKTVDEEQKYGIFFDDDYDYLQHLKGVEESNVTWERVDYTPDKKKEETKMVQLPSSVFASNVEESVGLLNKAAPIRGPRLDLDPDIVAAMDEDFDFNDPDNLLEDNFMELANGCLEDVEEDSDEEYVSELDDDVASLESETRFSEEETKSRFTNYSLSSSVMRRNGQLTLLDDKFEKMFNEYEESEIGGLECDEIEGYMSTENEMLLQLAKEFKQNIELEANDVSKQKILSLIKEEPDEDMDSESELKEFNCPDKTEKWDCESILSTYSNIYNHPGKILEPKISRIKVSKTTGIPLNVIGDTKLTAKALAALNGMNDQSVGTKSVISNITELSIRSKDETLEEKRKRKQALKEYRRERRVEKKANTAAFKEEKQKQEKVLKNVKNNLQGIKLI